MPDAIFPAVANFFQREDEASKILGINYDNFIKSQDFLAKTNLEKEIRMHSGKGALDTAWFKQSFFMRDLIQTAPPVLCRWAVRRVESHFQFTGSKNVFVIENFKFSAVFLCLDAQCNGGTDFGDLFLKLDHDLTNVRVPLKSFLGQRFDEIKKNRVIHMPQRIQVAVTGGDPKFFIGCGWIRRPGVYIYCCGVRLHRVCLVHLWRDFFELTLS